jgi:hypothetical protein
MMETRFLDLIRGALIAAPTKLVPVMKIPHAAPRTESVNANAIPSAENMYGEPTHSYIELVTLVATIADIRVLE